MRCLASLLLVAALGAADSDYQQFDDRAMLGVNMAPPSAAAQQRNGTDPNTGVEVNTVYPDTAADRMGLQPGDVIVSVNGGDITSMTDLRNEVALAGVGGDVAVTVLRNGETINPNDTLGEWPKSVPYQPIDDAAERRFRDWQAHRLDRTQQAVNQMRRQVEDLERRQAKADAPMQLPAGPMSPMAAAALPASQALAKLPAWRLHLQLAHDSLAAADTTAVAKSQTTWDARVLLGTPAPEIY